MAKRRIWLSYDLGLKGDYEGPYTWLADHQARECGDSIATFRYDVRDDLADELLLDLKRSVTLGPRDRVYVIWQDEAMHGKFVHGSRKTPPWSGYGSGEPGTDE